MQILLIRHTRVDVPPNICYGQTDVPLAQTFENEQVVIAKRVGEWQAKNTAKAVWSSPLSRCTRLAQSLALPLGLSVQTDARLLEMSFGRWENQSWGDIPPDELQHWMGDYLNVAPPEGELLDALWQRCQQFLQTLDAATTSQIIVAHGGSIRALLCCALGLTKAEMMRFHLDYGSIIGLKKGYDDAWQLQFLENA